MVDRPGPHAFKLKVWNLMKNKIFFEILNYLLQFVFMYLKLENIVYNYNNIEN